MKRVLVTAAIAATLSGWAMAGHQATAGSPASTIYAGSAQKASEGPCDEIRWERGAGAVRALITCVWDRFHVGTGGSAKATAVATCESGLRPSAVGGANLGLFQHNDCCWRDRYEGIVLGFPLRRSWDLSSSALDARTNAIVTAIYVRRWGWGAWSCG